MLRPRNKGIADHFNIKPLTNEKKITHGHGGRWTHFFYRPGTQESSWN